MGISTGFTHFGGADADALAAGGHEHELVFLGHGDGPDDGAGLVGDLHGDDAFASARLFAVVLEGGALADAVFRSD